MLQGKRLPDGAFPGNPGEYCKNEHGRWLACPPDGCGVIGLTNIGNRSWNVVEHPDGTISVTPSIRILGDKGKPDRWHGFLTKGIWKEC
jgi:hypothetical protein